MALYLSRVRSNEVLDRRLAVKSNVGGLQGFGKRLPSPATIVRRRPKLHRLDEAGVNDLSNGGVSLGQVDGGERETLPSQVSIAVEYCALRKLAKDLDLKNKLAVLSVEIVPDLRKCRLEIT